MRKLLETIIPIQEFKEDWRDWKSSPDTGNDTFDKTYLRYPFRWYESRALNWALTAVLLVSVAAVQLGVGLYPNVAISIIATLFYLSGNVWDIHTTHQVMSIKPIFDKLGLEFPVAEDNPYLPDYPTLREQLFNKLNWLIGLLAILTFILPAYGIARGVGHIVAGVNNLRNRKRLLMLLRIGQKLRTRCD